MELVELLRWPITLLIIAIVYKPPFSELIKKTTNILYRKNDEGSEFSANFLSAGLENAKLELEIQNPDTKSEPTEIPDPKIAISDANRNLEIAAESKLVELSVDLDKEEFKGTALDYLIYKSALSPKLESATKDIQFLTNQVAHYDPAEIDTAAVEDYLAIATKIGKAIAVIERLPAMNLHAITMIVRNISIVLDSNKYSEVSIDEIHKRIEDGSILDFLADFEEASELKGLINSGLWKGFERFYVQSLQSIYHAYAGDERRKWSIQKSGLCLLLAWTNEILQMGSGWHPNTNLSHLDDH